MKLIIIIILLLLCCYHSSSAQSDSIVRQKGYQIWITTYDSQAITGTLHQVNDSTIDIMGQNLHPGIKMGFHQKATPGKSNITRINVRLMDVVKVRKKGNSGLGILIGAMSGLIVGGLIDVIYYSSWSATNPKQGDNAIEGAVNTFGHRIGFGVNASLIGIACIGTGIAVGAAVGSAKITIPIGGNPDQFNQSRSTLNNYASLYNSELANKPFIKFRDTITDVDGNTYTSLAIGGQVWMAEDLKVTHYRDGSAIGGLSVSQKGKKVFYNWLDVQDRREICPSGWHIPHISEWTSLFNCLGGEGSAGKKMEKGFSTSAQGGHWWSSSELDTARARSIYLNSETIGVMFSITAKTALLSVRCIRN